MQYFVNTGTLSVPVWSELKKGIEKIETLRKGVYWEDFLLGSDSPLSEKLYGNVTVRISGEKTDDEALNSLFAAGKENGSLAERVLLRSDGTSAEKGCFQVNLDSYTVKAGGEEFVLTLRLSGDTEACQVPATEGGDSLADGDS